MLNTAVFQWHKIEIDGLPEKSGHYLVCHKDDYMYVFMYLPYSAKHKLFNADDEDKTRVAKRYAIDVDYWAEMPNMDEVDVMLNVNEEKTVIKTGYERVKCGEKCYVQGNGERVSMFTERNSSVDDKHYADAVYYSDEQVAINNSRADRLLRQLRRFAVEHRHKELDWNDCTTYKYCIRCSYENGKFFLGPMRFLALRGFGQIYFDSLETVQLAIDTFYDELMWYFTEYKDRI